MTKRDFFILIIKLFGLFWLISALFSVLPSNISYALSLLDAPGLLWVSLTVLIVLGLFLLLVFRAHKVVDLLKLDAVFDSPRIELGGIRPLDILKLGIFITGALLLLNNIPPLLSNTLLALQDDAIGAEPGWEFRFNWAVSALNVLLGYLLLSNYARLARRLHQTPPA